MEADSREVAARLKKVGGGWATVQGGRPWGRKGVQAPEGNREKNKSCMGMRVLG